MFLATIYTKLREENSGMFLNWKFYSTCISMGLMEVLLKLTDLQVLPLLSKQFQKNICWMMTNLFRHKPPVRIDTVKQLMPALKFFIRYNATEVK